MENLIDIPSSDKCTKCNNGVILHIGVDANITEKITVINTRCSNCNNKTTIIVK